MRASLKLLVVWLVLGCSATVRGEALRPARISQDVTVRVATYNIKFLKSTVDQQGDRLAKLKRVIEDLDAHVIALQEIDDRAALRKVFDETEWKIVIDDQSGDDQDLALVFREPLRVKGIGANLDAEPGNFLFPDAGDNEFFPNRRDVLVIELELPALGRSFFVMVNHAKSRFGGRATTDPKREGAARKLIQVLEARFDESLYVLLGDFNDSPDDRSLNILEGGDPNAVGGPEEIDGPFLINLTESLWARDHVSWGRVSTDIVSDRVSTVDPGARKRNNDARGTDGNTGDILFDNILVPPGMHRFYVPDSCKVFDRPDGVRGNSNTRASDHLPVYADFTLTAESPGGGGPATGIRIVSLLPDPAGDDRGKEQVTLGNFTGGAVSLAGWKLKDRGGNTYALAGSLNPGEKKTITMTQFTMPLNNSGDSVTLLDDQGQERDQVTYQASQVQQGKVIAFQ